MQGADVQGVIVSQARRNSLCDGNGPVVTARATDAKRDEVLTLMAVAIQHGGKHLQEIVYEFLRRWLREHIVGNWFIRTAVSAQFWNPIGVGQEPHVYY